MVQKQEFYRQTIQEAAASLHTDPKRGLSAQEAERRLWENGENRLPEAEKKSVLQSFLEQLNDPLIYVLLAAALISVLLGEYSDAGIIAFVVCLNAAVGVLQEGKAQRALDSLKQLMQPRAVVIRDGSEQEIPAAKLVVGDLVCLQAGAMVPADLRLVEAENLQLQEAALTGENLPVQKQTARLSGKQGGRIPLGDRNNMTFLSTMVSAGRGTGMVCAVGLQTQIGKIAALMHESREETTPLQKKLGELGKFLSLGSLGICIVLFLLAIVQKRPVFDMLLTAISLAVAAVPEGLPAVVTLCLALSVTRMAKINTIIRRLPSVETLGAVSVVCSDKTGTLTQNKMTVEACFADQKLLPAERMNVKRNRDLFLAMLLCNDAQIEKSRVGDPTELALLDFGARYGFEKNALGTSFERKKENAFDSDRKMMSTVHKLAGGLMLVTKGATDVLLDRCVVTPEERARIEQVNEQFSNEGLRVLAFACRSVDGPAITLADENSLTFLGLIAMMDPPREESKAAVAECIRAGIRPIMITGDHKITAAAIAREIGILRDGTEAVEGAVIDGMSDEELQDFVPKVSVYARVSPEHKIRIVRAWQQRGNLVAMTGDGVNDAPALKQADIGVAMGITGTEVAKDAAGMVLADDNFATIVKAVKNGRNVYANIKRAIQFLLSGNTAGILTVLYASLMGLPVPFAAVHLLFINLLTDSLPAIALGMEPHTDEVMSEKPRPRNEGILTKPFLYSVGVEGLVIAAATVTAFYLGLNAGGAAAGQTMAFSTLCLSRLFHGFSCKSQHPVLLTRHFWNNRALLGAFTIGALLLGLVLLVPALEPLFAIAPLSVGMVGAIVGLAFGSMLVIQLLKWIRR